jgi:hypothetical protein
MGNIGMEILKFENAPAPRKSAPKKSNLKSLAGLATVAAVAVLGSTLAANISLGTSSLEFGQGVQTTAACDSSITVSPKVTFVNGATPQFMLSTISLSGLDITDQSGGSEGCDGKSLRINAYGDTSATPLNIASASNVAYAFATVGVKAAGAMTSSPAVTLATSGTTTNVSVDVVLSAPQATSGAVYKLTLQSE